MSMKPSLENLAAAAAKKPGDFYGMRSPSFMSSMLTLCFLFVSKSDMDTEEERVSMIIARRTMSTIWILLMMKIQMVTWWKASYGWTLSWK